MATSGTIAIEGAAELERKLKQLEAKVARKIASQAMRAGAKEILTVAQQIVPVDSGLLKKSLKVRAGKRKRDMVRFLVTTLAGDYKGETFYGAFVEMGHKAGKRQSRGRGAKANDTREIVAPKPYLGPAFERGKVAALSRIIETTRAGILSAVN